VAHIQDDLYVTRLLWSRCHIISKNKPLVCLCITRLDIVTCNPIVSFVEGYLVWYDIIIVDNSSTIDSYCYISVTAL
jgi:hypothetical protein